MEQNTETPAGKRDSRDLGSALARGKRSCFAEYQHDHLTEPKTKKGGITMNFKLSEEHEMIRKMVRDFATKEVAPTAAERDEEERFDREIFDKMAELGLTGIPGRKSTAELVQITWHTVSQLKSYHVFVHLLV